MNRISKSLFGGALISAGLVGAASADNFGPNSSTRGIGHGAIGGGGKDYQVLWDQSAFDGDPYNDLVDQNFGDFPTYSAFMVDDFTTGGQTWNITSVHTYFTYNPYWVGITSASLQFYKKGGSQPDDTNDLAPEYKVPVSVINHGSFMEVAATGLNIPELNGVNGDYWVGLTPNADFGQFGQAFHLMNTVQFADEASLRNPGGSFNLPQGTGWGPAGGLLSPSQHLDMAFLLDGDIVPAPGTAALLGLGGLLAGRRRRN